VSGASGASGVSSVSRASGASEENAFSVRSTLTTEISKARSDEQAVVLRERAFVHLL